MDSTGIMFTTSLVIMFASLLSASYKTGFAFLSIWSVTRRNQPKFKVDKSKIGKFAGVIFGVLLLNIAYGLIVIRDTSELEGILIISFFNTIFIGYGLSYWILLKKKKDI